MGSAFDVNFQHVTAEQGPSTRYRFETNESPGDIGEPLELANIKGRFPEELISFSFLHALNVKLGFLSLRG